MFISILVNKNIERVEQDDYGLDIYYDDGESIFVLLRDGSIWVDTRVIRGKMIKKVGINRLQINGQKQRLLYVRHSQNGKIKEEILGYVPNREVIPDAWLKEFRALYQRED